MYKKYIAKTFIIIFVFCFLIGCDNDTPTNGNNKNDYDNEITTVTEYNENEKPVNTNPMNPLQGTWVKDGGGLYPNEIDFYFSGHTILKFRYTWGGVDNKYYTVNRSFRGLSYNEPTVNFLTYHDVPRTISFIAIITDNKLTVSGLRGFSYASPTSSFPFERTMDLKSWNGTYTRKE